jgi:Tfp pilus assembly protein PilX
VRVRGIALLMGLVLLAAISLVALLAANGAALQQRMAANFGVSTRTLGHATRATAAARDWLYSRPDFERENGCLSDCLLPAAIHNVGQLPRDPEFESAAWWRSNAVAAGSHPETGEPLATGSAEVDPPRWLIEEVHYRSLAGGSVEAAVAGVGYYRILAWSSGNTPGSLAVTESIVARPWDGEIEPLSYPSDLPSGTFCRQFDPTLACGVQAWRRRR